MAPQPNVLITDAFTDSSCHSVTRPTVPPLTKLWPRADALLRWGKGGNCPHLGLTPKRDMKRCLTISEHQHTGTKRRVLWHSNTPKCASGRGSGLKRRWGSLRRTRSQRGRGHPSHSAPRFVGMPQIQSWTVRKVIECLTQGLLSSHSNIYHSTTAYFFEPPCIFL